MSIQPEKQRNLFMRELEKVLTTRGQRLEMLYTREGKSQAKFQQTPGSPARFPVPDPEELDHLDLSKQERAHLRAALLATEIERMLGDYLEPGDALLVSERLLSPIEEALQKRRRGRGPDGEAREDTEMDQVWETIQTTLDSSMLALQRSAFAFDKTRVKKVKQALAGFQEALAELNRLDQSTRSLPLWREYYEDARHGIEASKEQLENLGEA